MEIELIEIREFLEQRSPFNTLSSEVLDELPKELSIRYLRRDSAFPPADANDSYLYIVRSGAVELRDEKDELCEKLGEGDMFTTPCQLLDLSRGCKGKTAEDALFYLVPCDTVKRLCKQHEAFNKHFSQSIRERLKHAVTKVKETVTTDISYMTLEVKDLIKRAPITVSEDQTIQEAAQLMSEHNVSSVLVMSGNDLAGLITDRDLRKRCVALGLSVEKPTRSIMTTNIETIQKNALMIQALMTMTRMHVHHLPVMEGGQLVGMLTATDLARHHSTNSAFIATDIRKAKSVKDLAKASARIPELQRQLANSSATALHIGEAVACITDSLTKRLIEMAVADLGPPPVPFAWLAGGSQARLEQTSHSDQDNAMIISDEMKPEHDEYFKALATFVTDGLNSCGFVYCPGDAMASNPKWRQPLRVWTQYFDEWIGKPDPMSLMLSSIFFDLRLVDGDGSLYRDLHRAVLAKTQQNRIFIAYIAANALHRRPPLGFFRQLVLIRDGEHDDTFDIKHRGIVPITDIARVYALSEGLEPVNTTERLRAAADAGAMSRDMAENLEDALEFIASLRIRHQAKQIGDDQPADNYLPPSSLSELEREHLKDAFRVIQTMQEALSTRYQAGRFG